jgi:hypothetical protein
MFDAYYEPMKFRLINALMTNQLRLTSLLS